MAFKNPLSHYFPGLDFMGVSGHVAVLERSHRKVVGLGKWIADLRSGEYEQAKDQLHDDGRDCCLFPRIRVRRKDLSQRVDRHAATCYSHFINTKEWQ